MSTIRSGVGDRGSGLLKALRRCRVRLLNFTEIFLFYSNFSFSGCHSGKSRYLYHDETPDKATRQLP